MIERNEPKQKEIVTDGKIIIEKQTPDMGGTHIGGDPVLGTSKNKVSRGNRGGKT